MENPSKKTYLDLYKGKPILIQASGPGLEQAHKDIAELSREGLEFVLAITEKLTQNLVDAYPDINEVIILTDEGGIRDEKGKIMPLLSEDDLKMILDGQKEGVLRFSSAMRKKIEEILQLLPTVGKVAITKTSELKDELLDWKGTGTLCVDLFRHEVGLMKPEDRPIFDAAYDANLKAGHFRKRLPEEYEELVRYHRLLRVKNSILGGYSMIPQEKDWVEFAAFWAGYLKSGVGSMMLEHAKAQTKVLKKRLYAITKSEETGRAFTEAGFNKVAWENLDNDHPEKLKSYPNKNQKQLYFYLP